MEKRFLSRDCWYATQSKFADIPGENGIRLRAEAYKPFFLRFGEGVRILEGCRFDFPERIALEDRVMLNQGVRLVGSGGIKIDRNTLLGHDVFIHSSNHAIEPRELAPFERGHVYQPVRIGANTIISAKVGVMPGSTLGVGVFVAFGAVVARGVYNDGATLAGVPARVSQRVIDSPPPEPSPEIVFVVSHSDNWRSKLEPLLAALRLPQVGIVTEGDQISPSVTTVILCGVDKQKFKMKLGPSVVFWSLCHGKFSSNTPNISLDNGFKKVFPTHLNLNSAKHLLKSGERIALGCEDNLLDIEKRFASSMFWLRQRLTKRDSITDEVEREEWLLALELIEFEGQGCRSLREFVEQGIKPKKNHEFLIEWIRGVLKKIGSKPRRRIIQARRVELVRSALGCEADHRRKILRTVEAGLLKTRNTSDVLAYWLVAHFLEDEDLSKRIETQLSNSDWSHEKAGFLFRGGKNLNSICFSPLVIVYYFFKLKAIDSGYQIPESLGKPEEERFDLNWRCLDSGGTLSGDLKISDSLLLVWHHVQSNDFLKDRAIVLSVENYKAILHAVESGWVELFKSMQFQANRPLIELSLWPKGMEAAVSIRYDVDRPVTAGRISEIVAQQKVLASGPCGTWFYFRDELNVKTEQLRLLRSFGQEIALHSVDETVENISGFGISHHSAPTATYWRGNVTTKNLIHRGAVYGEFLLSQLSRPRPSVFSPCDPTKGFWHIPLHFPLEGATNSSGTDYFDQYMELVEELVRASGHVIIGTHPDLEQTPLDIILRRKCFSRVWFATIQDVIDRVRKLHSYNGVFSIPIDDDQLALVSDEYIEDLTVKVWIRDKCFPIEKTIQLQKNLPRFVMYNI